MRLAAVGLLTLAAGVLLLLRFPVAEAQPEVTATFPEDGDVLAEPPSRIRVCFASPVNIRDPGEGGDFGFTVTTPEGRNLGLRIVFQRNGLGVDVFPGVPDEPSEGEWGVDWRVTDPDTLEPTTGTINFTVGPDGSPVPEEPPISCAGGGPPTPRISPDSTPTPGDAAEGGDEGDDEGDDGTDVVLLALITAGAVGGAVVLGLILVLVRRRIGVSSRRPPPGEGG